MTPAAASPAANAAEEISFRLSGRPLLPFREDERLVGDGLLYPTGERDRPLREVMMLGDAPRRDGELRSYAGGIVDVSIVGISSMTKACFVVSDLLLSMLSTRASSPPALCRSPALLVIWRDSTLPTSAASLLAALFLRVGNTPRDDPMVVVQ